MHFWFQSVASNLKPSSLYHKSSSGNAEPLNQGFVCTLTHAAPPPRDIWQCLEIFWWVGRGQGFCYEYPTMHTGQPSTTKNLQPKMTVMPQVRKSVLKKGRMMSCPPRPSCLTAEVSRPYISVLKHIYSGPSVPDSSLSDKMVAECSVPFMRKP